MSFHEAHDFVVNGPIIQTNIINSQSGIDILREASTPEAAVDAIERSYAPSCHPGTREQYIQDITTWAAASNDEHLPIYWMSGPAGVGKSAIAQTCAQMVKKSGRLGAAFFFSINGRQTDHTRFFPTLAYQLATTIPDYRETVNRSVLNDKTLVTKTLETQFESLIIEPLQQLKGQGKEVRMRPIFIDGLDECKSVNAQVEIIKLIAASVKAKSTPFRWAIFSRPEPRIVSTFRLPHISPHCRLVYLPISRDSDREIEAYLRGGFQNILQRRDMTLSSPWPTDEDILKLIDASAGLFAYCAALLRFIDTHSFSGFKEALQVVLKVIAQPYAQRNSVFAELDKLYMLILERVPRDLLEDTLILLRECAGGDFGAPGGYSDVATTCNRLGISETMFKSICYHLQAVITYREPVQPFQVLDQTIDLTRSYWDQDSSLDPSSPLYNQMHTAHGTLTAFHKSFKDFLVDPKRSSRYSLIAVGMAEKYYDRMAQQHAHYASSYVIQGTKLVLAPGLTSSSISLSWPQGTEFVDSYLKFHAFYIISDLLSHQLPSVTLVPGCFSSCMRLELDHYMSWVSVRMVCNSSLPRKYTVMGCGGLTRTVGNTIFGRIQSDGYDKFSTAIFLERMRLLEDKGVIKPFQPSISSGLAPTHNPSSLTESGKQNGLYILGREEKSVVWYWEFDDKERYCHEFRTTDRTEAMGIYETEKFNMWDESWVPPPHPSRDLAASTSSLPPSPPVPEVDPSEQSKSDSRGERQMVGALGTLVPQLDSTKATSPEPKQGEKRKANISPPATHTKRQRRRSL